jgi:hypothetical protein
MGISCVHRDIPKDLILTTEERRPPLSPHLVVFCRRSVEDPNPVPGTLSLDLRLVRVNQDP